MFKYLGTNLNQSSIPEEIKSRLKSRNACLSFGAEFFVFQFAIQKYKDYDIQNYNFAVLYGRETWSPALREERMLRVFEKRVLRIIFGPKRDTTMLVFLERVVR